VRLTECCNECSIACCSEASIDVPGTHTHGGQTKRSTRLLVIHRPEVIHRAPDYIRIV